MMKNAVLRYLFSPSSNINYNFIVSTYAFFSVLCIVLYFLEAYIFISAQYQEEQGNETLKELAESTKGLYMIFIPFLPSLVWSLIMRGVWRGQKQHVPSVEKKKKDN